MWLLVGLGNPGPKYARNRHNVGFMAIDELASRLRVDSFQSKFGGETAKVSDRDAVLLKPMQYMNVSGQCVQQAAAFYKIEPDHIVVAHDELDLDFGVVRIKVGGGHAGHNGIRSIIQQLGTPDFVRIRCGVGRPPGSKGFVADWVLSDFSKSQQTEAEIMVKEAADAFEDIPRKGPLIAMNRFNVREKPEA
jgi:PTH1 family peptidyl-tRNA hydrolase